MQDVYTCGVIISRIYHECDALHTAATFYSQSGTRAFASCVSVDGGGGRVDVTRRGCDDGDAGGASVNTEGAVPRIDDPHWNERTKHQPHLLKTPLSFQPISPLLNF